MKNYNLRKIILETEESLEYDQPFQAAFVKSSGIEFFADDYEGFEKAKGLLKKEYTKKLLALMEKELAKTEKGK
jgi:hypothetical protein